MFCYVYLLRSTLKSNLYIGFTHDLRKRLAEHNKGLNRSTKPHMPWELIYYEAHRKEADARKREKYLKTTAGKQALRKMLHEEFAEPNDLSQQKVYPVVDFCMFFAKQKLMRSPSVNVAKAHYRVYY